LKSKLEAQEMQFNMQKQNHEKTLKGLRSNIDVLETRLGFNRLVIVDNN
jgi:hypothetical protein